MLVVARTDRHMAKSDRSACYNELTDNGCVALPGRSMRICNVVSVSMMSRGGPIIPDCDNRPPWPSSKRLFKNPPRSLRSEVNGPHRRIAAFPLGIGAVIVLVICQFPLLSLEVC